MAENVTRERVTERRYMEVARNLKKRFEASGREQDLLGFKGFLQSLADDWEPSTWRHRRASLVCYLEKKRDYAERKGLNDYAEAFQKEIDMLFTIKASKGAPVKRTSAKKMKRLPIAQLQRTQELLDKARSEYRRLTILMLICGEIVGARPKEWVTAKIVENQDTRRFGISFENAKKTNGRACGESRIVWLPTAMPSELIEAIQTLIVMIDDRLEKESWKNIYDNCRQLLRRVQIADGFKQLICFYATRHQFTANLKASKKNLTDIASLMGHLSIKTATENYGRRATGRGSIQVIANEDNVEIVKQHSKSKDLTAASVLRMEYANENKPRNK